MSQDPGSGSGADAGHGSRLTDQAYQKAVVRLYESLSAEPSREHEREVRRAELDLAVDHRLGVDFPADRREQLWEVRERIEKRRLRLAAKAFLARLFSREPGPVTAAQRLAEAMMDAYAEVLTEEELERFFGPDWRRPTLPVDWESER